MNDTQPYQFESEEPLQDEDDSDCFGKKGETSKRTGNTNWCLYIVCVLQTQVIS